MTSFYTPWGREPIPAAETPLQLSDAVLTILHLAAAHDGVSPEKLIERLVCARAEAIGLSALVDALTPSGAARLAPGGAGEKSPGVRSDACENERSLTRRHGNSRDHSCRGGDHG
ncbi:MAG: hypothetical protein ACXIVF_15580 [Rhizobiaceae bacterium]